MSRILHTMYQNKDIRGFFGLLDGVETLEMKALRDTMCFLNSKILKM